jgi:glucosamine 6-phosphate synthetase-like amidotransferase/phosphosugar isomerase protein
MERALLRGALTSWRAGGPGPDFLYLGRGSTTPSLRALKMKEISYIHAEGYPAGR